MDSMSDTAQAPAPELPAQPARRGGNRSVASLVISLAVVLAVLGLIILIVPRPSEISQPPVDVVGTAAGAASAATFHIDVPTGLPDGWQATSVRWYSTTDGIMTWHVGYETPDVQYAALEQASDVTHDWVVTSTEGGVLTGTQQVAGATWEQLLHKNRLQRTLMLTTGNVTTLVTGTASWAELGTLAASLEPYGQPGTTPTNSTQ